MMSCQDCEKYLEAFLDHALEVKESLDVEAHMRSCTSCADRAEAERAFQRFVRQQVTEPPLPEEKKRRIVRQAMQAAQHDGGRRPHHGAFQLRDFIIGLATAAALFLLVFKPFFFTAEADDMMQKFANEASMTYSTYMTQHVPPEFVNTDDKIVTQWLNTLMGYRLKMPCITDQATKLLGGRLCRLFDRKSAAMIYERNGANLVLFAFKGGQFTMPERYKVPAKGRELYIRTISGRPVAMWKHGDITYSMVGDIDRDDLLQVAKTVNYR